MNSDYGTQTSVLGTPSDKMYEPKESTQDFPDGVIVVDAACTTASQWGGNLGSGSEQLNPTAYSAWLSDSQ